VIITNKKIILFTSLYPNNLLKDVGIFNYSRVKALRKLNIDVQIIAPIGLTPPRFELKMVIKNLYYNFTKIPPVEVLDGIKIYHPKWLRLNRALFWKYEALLLWLFSGRKIKKIILSYKPDIIIGSWLNPYGVYAKYIKKYYSKPIVCYAEGSDVLILPDLYKKQWRIIENDINKYLDNVILISNYMNDFVKEKRNLLSNILVEDGYDEENFYYCDPSKIIKGRIVTIGSLIRIKGHDILIKALKLIKSEIELVIIGDGGEKSKLEELCHSLNLSHKVMFKGFIDHSSLKDFIDTCQVFCMPSRNDAQPASALEALACGRPLVASYVDGLKDLVVNDVNGYHFYECSEIDLANKLEMALFKKWDYEKIANETKGKYGWEKSIKILLDEVNNEF